MTVSPTLRWMLLLTVAVSVFEFFQGDAPLSDGTTAPNAAVAKPTRPAQPANTANQAANPTALADANWPLRLPDPRDSEWPRQRLASSYGWEPVAAPAPMALASKPVGMALAPTPPSPAPVPQGPPPVPPFPYQMVGLLEQDGSTSAWLTSGASGSGGGVGSGSTRTVVPEQVLDGRWRVGAISPRGMSVTWITTGQTLQIKYAP